MADPTSACEVEVGEQREEGEEEEPEKEEEEEQDEWWRYALLSLVDVEANVLCVWAYQYTSITSAMLLDCFTIPCVMVLSCLLLGARYERAHFAGALLCFAGVGLIVASDLQNNGSGSDDDDGDDHNNDDNEYPHAWLGDLMCVCGAFLYAVSNVVQERWVRAEAGPPRFLGRLGLCGVAVSGLQAALFERAALVEHTHWCLAGVGAWAGYTVALSAAYTVTSWFLVDADAALFNLSLLTADVYAVVFAYFVQGNLVSVLYAPAFGCTMAGIFVYHRAPKPTFAHTRRAAAANTAFSAAAAFAPTASAAAAIDPTPAAEPAAEAPTERAVRLSE
jgi:solute carrier family 35 protein F1/2